MDLQLALDAQARIEDELADLLASGVINKVVAGAGGSGQPVDWTPSVGIHLSVFDHEATDAMVAIMKRVEPITGDVVNVNFYPLRQAQKAD